MEFQDKIVVFGLLYVLLNVTYICAMWRRAIDETKTPMEKALMFQQWNSAVSNLPQNARRNLFESIQIDIDKYQRILINKEMIRKLQERRVDIKKYLENIIRVLESYQNVLKTSEN